MMTQRSTSGSHWFLDLRANDPSAGSPTETLLRLLLPLNEAVRRTFHKSDWETLSNSRSELLTESFNR
jgi:hypothetical protein